MLYQVSSRCGKCAEHKPKPSNHISPLQLSFKKLSTRGCTTGVSNSYKSLHSFCPSAITSTSLYSKLLLFSSPHSTAFAVSHREQLARVKSVMRAVCCSSLWLGFISRGQGWWPGRLQDKCWSGDVFFNKGERSNRLGRYGAPPCYSRLETLMSLSLTSLRLTELRSTVGRIA